MTHTFYLKEPRKEKKTLIYFSCYFKDEQKKFVYSTGEKILPQHWNFKNNQPKLKGIEKDENSTTINNQLNRYSKVFSEVNARCKIMNEIFSSKMLRNEFNREFKRVENKSNNFFDAYNLFIRHKQKRKLWSHSTVKRHKNIMNHLKSFQKAKNYKLTFSNINEEFYTLLLDYFYNDLDHFSNTVARNIGLIKTFLNWALEERYSYNESFKNFKKPKTIITQEVALTLNQVSEIFKIECENIKLEKVKDVFVFQCLTGLRYGEMKYLNRRVISNDTILLKEEKDLSKDYREIPLTDLAKFILVKYDYQLPIISNQKQNKYLKEILKKANYHNETEYTRVKGVEVKTFIEPLYNRISTHTARRTFVTIMRNNGVDDKTIMSITGHKDLKTFNAYHKVNNDSRKVAVNKVFGKIDLPNLKKA